jgi:hypothetical protein
MGAPETPKIHIDTDWKAQARAEKDRLAREEAQSEATRRERGRPGELPKADFRALVGVLASQAMLGLGAVGDPRSGRVIVDLQGAQFAIDLLDVLQQKTKDNLDSAETEELRLVLAELRARFVEISGMVTRQMAAPPPEGVDAPRGKPGPR